MASTVTPTMFKDQVPGGVNSYCDWYCESIFKANGKEYCMVLTFSKHANKAHTKIQLVEGPLVVKEVINEKNRNIFDGSEPQKLTDGYHPLGKIKVIQPAEIEYFFDDDGFTDQDIKFSGDDDCYVVSIGKMTYTYYKNHTNHISIDLPKFKLEADFKRIHPEIWYGDKPFGTLDWNQKMSNIGFEEFGTIEGVLNFKGEEIIIKPEESYALFEHVWIPEYDPMLFRYIDWIWFICPEATGLLVNSTITTDYETGAIGHKCGGAITLRDNPDEPMYIKAIKVTPTDRAFSVPQLRFIPTGYELEAVTDKGVLKLSLQGGPIVHGTRTGSWQPNRTKFGIPGWMLTWHQIPLETSGTFTFNDNRVVQLSTGRAVDEPMMSSPIS